MIWIRYIVSFLEKVVSAELNFDKQHEKNFKLMYEDTVTALGRDSCISIEQFVIVIAHNCVFSLRNNLFYDFFKNLESKKALNKLNQKNEILKIRIEFFVDNFSKRKISLEIQDLENSD